MEVIRFLPVLELPKSHVLRFHDRDALILEPVNGQSNLLYISACSIEHQKYFLQDCATPES